MTYLPLLATVLVIAPPAPPLGPGNHSRTLEWESSKRTYNVHVPPTYDARRPTPVVLVYHGGGSNANQWIPFCGLNKTADEKGFIAVYPDGTGKVVEGYQIFGWNGGPRRPGGGKPELDRVDDVDFTRAMIDDLEKLVNVDSKRVYATGMSMGGIMVYRLASELSDRIAAIAPIAGPMGTETCSPRRPVSVIHFHGTDDPAVPMTGGKGKIDPSGTDFVSVEHSIRAWVKADECVEQPTTIELPNRVDDGTKATRTTYRGGKEGSEVVLITIEGGGHTWPGREFGPEMKILGPSSKDISANDMLWEFFEKHPMP